MTSTASPAGTLAQRLRFLQEHCATHELTRARFGKQPDPAALERIASCYLPPAWSSGHILPAEALFLYDMVSCVRPDRVLEIGTASGASAAVLTLAMHDAGLAPRCADGRASVQSFDISPTCYWDNSLQVGAAVAEMFPDLADGCEISTDKTALDAGRWFARHPVELVFIDGNHQHPWPVADLLALVPALKPGAWIILDDLTLNATADADEQRTGNHAWWRASGPEFLFADWPFEKFCGAGACCNVGAIRLPEDRTVSVADLHTTISRKWETQVPELTRLVLE